MSKTYIETARELAEQVEARGWRSKLRSGWFGRDIATMNRAEVVHYLLSRLVGYSAALDNEIRRRKEAFAGAKVQRRIDLRRIVDVEAQRDALTEDIAQMENAHACELSIKEATIRSHLRAWKHEQEEHEVTKREVERLKAELAAAKVAGAVCVEQAVAEAVEQMRGEAASDTEQTTEGEKKAPKFKVGDYVRNTKPTNFYGTPVPAGIWKVEEVRSEWHHLTVSAVGGVRRFALPFSCFIPWTPKPGDVVRVGWSEREWEVFKVADIGLRPIELHYKASPPSRMTSSFWANIDELTPVR